MTGKKINIIVCIMVIFFVLFFAGSFAYQGWLIQKSDEQEAQSTQQWEESASKENASGDTSK